MTLPTIPSTRDVVTRTGWPQTLTTAGGSVNTNYIRLHCYSIVTDGANDATLTISQGGTTVWVDICIGTDKCKTGGFPYTAGLGGANKSGILTGIVTGTGATAYLVMS